MSAPRKNSQFMACSHEDGMGFENHFAALRCEETNCRRHGYARYEAISGDCVGAFHGDDGVRLWLRHERATAPSPPPVSVSVSPTSASIPVNATQQFTATLQNDP